jgi:MFS family permease
VRTLLLDIRPLRTSPAFRRLWAGSLLSGFGSQVASFALLYYIWTTSHNASLLALVGLSQLVPLIVFSLVGGHLADRLDRRRLVLLTRGGQVLAAVAMAIVVISGTHRLGLLFSLIAVQNALVSLGAPAARAFIPRILRPDLIAAGNALNSVGMQAILIGSPVIAGFAIAAWGVDGCFVLDAATFLAAIYGALGLPAMPPGITDESQDHSVVGGLRLVLRSPLLIGTFLLDLNATVLSMPVALFPIINSERFGGSPATLGLLMPSVAVGGVIIGTLSGRVTESSRPGALMLIGGAAWAGGLAAFAVSGSLWLSLPLLMIAGAGDAMSVISRGTIVQRVTPDGYRGRVNALDFVVGAGGPQLGNIRATLVASVTSGGESMFLGGIAALAGAAVFAFAAPSLRRYRTDTAQHPEP